MNNLYLEQGNETGIVCHRFQDVGSVSQPHRHNTFLLFLFEQGEGIHSVDFADHAISGRQCHLLFPGQVYQWHLKNPAKGYQLVIGKKTFETLFIHSRFSFARFRKDPALTLCKDSFQSILSELQCIERELKSEVVFQEVVHLRCKLIGLLIATQLGPAWDTVATNRTKQAMIRFEDLVDIHFKEERSVGFYASRLNISPNYLSILCQRESGVPARVIIQERLLLEAKRMLFDMESPIKDIADSLGFKDQAHFSNFFKQYTGVSPRQFGKR